MIIIGIDPGKYGGIAFMNKGENTRAFPLPTVDDRVDVGKLQEMIYEIGYHEVNFWGRAHGGEAEWAIAYVEVQQTRAGNKGNLLIGANYGRILAVLELMDISIREVTPRKWKGSLFPDQKTEGDKDVSIKYCVEAGYDLPSLRPRGKKLHDGVADAICIAVFGVKDAEL